MGKLGYRRPHWWFNTRLEHAATRSFGHMFLCLPAGQHAPIASRRPLAKTTNRDADAVVKERQRGSSFGRKSELLRLKPLPNANALFQGLSSSESAVFLDCRVSVDSKSRPAEFLLKSEWRSEIFVTVEPNASTGIAQARPCRLGRR